MSHGNISDFYLISIVWVYLSQKKKNREVSVLKVIEILKIFFIDKDIKSDFTMANKRMSDSVSVLLFGLNFVIKLKNFYFENHWNTLIFFYKQRYGVKFEYVS